MARKLLRRLLELPGDINAALAERASPIEGTSRGIQVTPPSWYPRGVRVLANPEMSPGEGTASGRTVMVGASAWPWHIKGLEPPLDPAMMLHELEHTRQMRRWGPLFPLMYRLHDLKLERTGKTPYVDNPFEVAAYGQEGVYKGQHAQRKTGKGPRGYGGGR